MMKNLICKNKWQFVFIIIPSTIGHLQFHNSTKAISASSCEYRKKLMQSAYEEKG